MRYSNVIRVSVSAAVLSWAMLANSASAQEVRAEQEASTEPEAPTGEIQVTASRRATSVLDVPYNISAFGGAELERSGIDSIADLARFAPGVSFIDRGERAGGTNNALIIRGLNSNPADQGDQPYVAAPTVSTYVGETPLFVNLRLRDIDRVEVLRGPQSTLYGAGSVGGAIRFIFNRPDPDALEISTSATGSHTRHSDSFNGAGDLLLNLPLTSNLAIRAFGGYERKAGFIDAEQLHVLDANGVPALAVPGDIVASPLVTRRVEDVNFAESIFGRIALGWEPSDSVRIEAAYMRQHDNVGDQQADTRGFGSGEAFRQYFAVREPLVRDVDLVSVDAEVDFGFATMTSATSYSHSRSRFTRDVTGLFQTALAAFYGPYPRLTVPEPNRTDDERFTQELRLVSDGDGWIDWTVGAYYSKRDARFGVREVIPGYAEWAGASGFQPGLATDVAYTLDRDINFEDRAIFGELTFNVTSRLDITLGARQFWQNFGQTIVQTLPICGIFCGDDAAGTTRGVIDRGFDDQIFKVNLAYELRDNLRLYATWSEGFRYGGGNALPLTGPFANPAAFLEFRPDKVTNWEVGIKGRWSGMNFSGAAFYIDWDDFQFDTFSPAGSFPMVFNGAGARSRGFEFEASGEVASGLNVTLGYTFVNAEVTEPFTFGPVQVRDGDPLPATPRHIVSASTTYTQELTDDTRLVYNLRGYYQSRSVAAFNATSANFIPIPSYNLWDGSVTYESRNWSLGLFVDNLFDNRVVFGGRTSQNWGQRFQFDLVNRPRTIGIRVGYRL